MVAISVARLTVADSTPGVFRRKRSMRLTQDAQVIPSIGRESSAGAAWSLILPGGISPALLCETLEMSDPVAIYRSIPGPWGPFFVAVTERGVVAVDWLKTEDGFRARLVKRLGGRIASVDESNADDERRHHLDVATVALE